MKKPKVLVIVGPTCSGKTALSLILAPHLSAEIISADSRQIFKFMDIGTAKPSPEELQRVPHHFVDILTPDQDFSAGEFGRQGRETIDNILKRSKTPIVVGGAGLYIRSLVDGLFDGPHADPELRKHMEEQIESEGTAPLLEELRSVDPAAAVRMLPSHTHRIIRALEVYYATGKPISELHAKKSESAFEPQFMGLHWERPKLYQNINERVERMMGQGFLEEVRSILQRGYAPGLNALQTVGYKEAIEHLEGKITLSRMVELMKQNSRRFAKRQMTWFRADKRIRWLEVGDVSELEALAGTILVEFRR